VRNDRDEKGDQDAVDDARVVKGVGHSKETASDIGRDEGQTRLEDAQFFCLILLDLRLIVLRDVVCWL